MGRNITQTALTLAATLLLAGPASANSDSTISLGVGTAMGVNRVTPLHAETQTAFTTELSIKLKVLHFLGVELSYSPTDKVSADQELVFNSTFRLSGLLYIVPTYPVNLYLKGGIGGSTIGDLVSIDNPTNSYHAGAGMDVHIGDHFVLGAEFLLLVPGVASVRDTIETFANEELKRYQNRDISNYEPADVPLGIKDFISTNNYRVALSARYYF